MLSNKVIEKFQYTIDTELSFLRSGPFILAVSGGVDSMVLLDLCKKAKLNFIVAHCNYQLRGEDSNLDEALVKETCLHQSIDCNTVRFDTNSMVNEGQSIQTLARDLRYDWFNEIKIEKHLSYVMLAHHLNDQLETMLINMSRGSGVKGLRGMEFNQDGKVRPLLAFTKVEIEAYATENNIQFRTDASNSDSKYKRNFIRNNITPLLEELHPEFWKNFGKTNEILLKQSRQLEDSYTTSFQRLKINEDSFELPVKDLIHWFETGEATPILSGFELSTKQIEELKKLANSENGKLLNSDLYTFIKDNDCIYIEKVKKSMKAITIENIGDFSISNKTISISSSPLLNEKLIEYELQVDAETIQFPLTIRVATGEDTFQPFGMNGKKSIHKFLKDKGLNHLKRRNALIIEDVKGVILVLGHQIDDSRKISSSTKNVLTFK
jgi:tRNA(Ile)-lysidine synthase